MPDDQKLVDVGAAPEALSLTNTQIFYAKTAIDLLVEKYTEQELPEHASACRMLRTRLEAHRSDKSEMTSEQMFEWQQRFAGCMGQPERLNEAAMEWFYELTSRSADPVRTFISVFLPTLNQARSTTAYEIIFTLHAKLNDMSEKNLDADSALNALIQYLDRGQQHLEAGQPAWHDDAELPEILEKLRRKFAQQQPVPTPPPE